ncbi:MAG: prkC 3 [Marmoricola sp.]|nr:prkC 3 [Marmoricola sp.]
MPPISMSPGTVLGDRYRLEVLLSEQDGARFWRATDTVLERSVAVHVVASTDPRAPTVLEAARLSSGVSEAHFLRVLDCDDVDGLTWVINEWGDGASLDVILAQGTLPPMRAAWLTREVAEAIAAAHARGVHHGRLNPEAVLVTESGAVKIIGFVVNAAFERSRATDTPYGPIGPREADVVDLAGILYAALTGRWPGVAPSNVPRAPREGNRPLRPRQVRAGVPRTLDAICDRVLHKEASQHVLPIETAHEIAAALSDFVGDPAAMAPADVPSLHADPEATQVGIPPVVEPVIVAAADSEVPTPALVPLDGDAPEPTPAPVVEPVVQPIVEPVVEPVVLPVVELEEPEPYLPPAAPAVAALAPPTDPDATMAAPAPFSPSGIELLEPEEWEPAAPPPPFEQPTVRPLFAEGERRVPPGAPPTTSTDPAPGERGHWPFEDEPVREVARPRRRSRFRIALVALLVLALLGVAYAVRQNDSGPGSRTGTSGSANPTATPTPTATTPVVTGTPLKIAAAGDFDPEGSSPEENPEQVPNAIDGNPDTVWKTSTYKDSALGGLKSGVGLVVDLGSDQKVGSVEVQLVGTPTDLEVYATSEGTVDPPAELADAQRQAGATANGTSVVLRIDPTVRTRYLILWLTKLPKSARGFQGQVAEITVRS